MNVRDGDMVIFDGRDERRKTRREKVGFCGYLVDIYIFIGGYRCVGGLLSSWLFVGVWEWGWFFTWGVLMTCKELRQCFSKQNS